MKLQLSLGTTLFLLICLIFPAAASAQCPSADADTVDASIWRHRLAAWVPNVTLELSSEFGRDMAGFRRALPENRAGFHLGPPAAASWRDSFGRTLDWQLAAHWDVVELVESLSPMQEPKSDDDGCEEPIGQPSHLEIEEEL